MGFKTVIGSTEWFSELCAYMAKLEPAQLPDFITIDSADGGTGAAPQELMDFMGLPLNESLPFVIDELKKYGLKDHITVIASGKLITPASAARAMATGADFVSSARGFMFSLGCIQAMQCHKNTCPTGITTHDARLQNGLDPTNKATRVANYHKQLQKEVEMSAHACGGSHPRQLRRKHVRLINATGRSVLMSEAHPEPITFVHHNP